VHKIIDCIKFSKFNKLLRVTVYVQRFIDLLRQREQDTTATQALPIVTGTEMRAAEDLWVCSIQAESFSAELSYCQSKGKQGVPIRVSQFGLFVDSSRLLRCRGRVNNSLLKAAVKIQLCSLLVTRGSSYSFKRVHEEIKHSGTADTLATLRERYWILKGRQTVKKVNSSLHKFVSKTFLVPKQDGSFCPVVI